MDNLSVWHWLILGLGLYLVYRAVRNIARAIGPSSPVPFSLKGWALRAASALAIVAVVVQGLQFLVERTTENAVRILILVPIYWVAGVLFGALAYGLMRAFGGAKSVARTAAPVIGEVARATGRAGSDALQAARLSPLEKKLAELDRLHTEGQITENERAAARAAALTKL